MKANGGMEIRLCVFLTLELERDSCPGCFPPRERFLYFHRIWGSVGHGLDGKFYASNSIKIRGQAE